MTECKTCWDTGFYHGYGGPCSEGCKPADATSDLRREWTEETQDATPPDPPVVGHVHELLMQNSTYGYAHELEELIRRVCNGEKVRIVWPPGTYGVHVNMTSRSTGTLELQSNARGWLNYVFGLTAELHLESYSSTSASGPPWPGVTLTRVSKGQEVKPGDVYEGRRGSGQAGKIVQVNKVNHDPDGQVWMLEVTTLNEYGQQKETWGMSGDFLGRHFEPNPTWKPKFQTGGYVPNTTGITPLKTFNWDLMGMLVDELKSPRHFLRRLLDEKVDLAQEYVSIRVGGRA